MSKIWLVTGSARGLGRSIVEAALAAGDKVVATARDPQRLADLKAQYGEAIEPFALDVTDVSAAKAAVDRAIERFGRLDVLVNNAGYGHMQPFEEVSDADFRAQIDTNLFGVVNLVRAALPTMRQQRDGYIINVSSVGGRVSTPGLSAYQAAKWAVGGLTEVLAQETASFGIKLVALEPGGMRTDWGQIARGHAQVLLPDYQPSVGAMLDLLKNYAGQEVGDPAKIAQLIVSLTRKESLPRHLLLGSDALHVYRQAEDLRQREAAEWAEISASTDFDGADISSFFAKHQA